MNRQSFLVAAVAVTALTLTAGPAASAPPEPTSDRLEVPAGDACDFAVVLESTGTSKVTEVPDGHLAFLRAGRATLTNVDTGATFSTARSGTQRVRTLPDGSTTVTFTGRNIVLQDEGFVLLVGTFSSTQGPPPDGESTPLEGVGRTVDLCAEVAS